MVALGVRDLATTIEFYEHRLALRRMKSPLELAFFTLWPPGVY